MLDYVVSLVVIAVAAYIIWRMVQPKYSVKIIVDEEGIQSHSGLPKAKEKSVLDFFQNNVAFEGKTIIYAKREENGYLRLRFRGNVAWGTRQQVRNFLNAEL